MDILVGILVSMIMGMGIGGGGFLVIYLVLYLNYPQILAQGTNLVFFIIASLGAIIIHTSKRKISFSQVLIMTIFGICGTLFGSNLANRINPSYVKVALGWLLTIAGALQIVKIIIKEINSNKRKNNLEKN